jgi:hypothetical protein
MQAKVAEHQRMERELEIKKLKENMEYELKSI